VQVPAFSGSSSPSHPYSGTRRSTSSPSFFTCKCKFPPSQGQAHPPSCTQARGGVQVPPHSSRVSASSPFLRVYRILTLLPVLVTRGVQALPNFLVNASSQTFFMLMCKFLLILHVQVQVPGHFSCSSANSCSFFMFMFKLLLILHVCTCLLIILMQEHVPAYFHLKLRFPLIIRGIVLLSTRIIEIKFPQIFHVYVKGLSFLYMYSKFKFPLNLFICIASLHAFFMSSCNSIHDFSRIFPLVSRG